MFLHWYGKRMFLMAPAQALVARQMKSLEAFPPARGSSLSLGAFFDQIKFAQPGQINEGSVHNEIMHITDLYPTIARIAGAKTPADRIVDGIDQLDLLTGQTKHSARDGFPVYNGDQLQAYKWRNWKVHFLTQEKMQSAIERPGLPKVYNLLTDPKEEFNSLHFGGLDGEDNYWVLPAVAKLVTDHKRNLAKEPPIKLGTPDPYTPPRVKSQ